MNSKVFNLSWGDVGRGLVMAILSGGFLALDGIIHTPGFNLFNTNLSQLGMLFINGAFVGFFGYLIKNFFTTQDGKFAGIIG